MVSFFGLKFGGDKRKKRAESPRQPPPQCKEAEEYIGRRESYFPLLSGGASGRPRTSQGIIGSKGPYPGDPSGPPPDADFKGVRAVLLGTTAALPAGTGPVLSPTLKTFSSDSNLKVSLTTRNFSSTSLMAPGTTTTRLGERGSSNSSSELGPRPRTATSMRGGSTEDDKKPPRLHINLTTNMSTSAFGGDGGAPSLKSPAAADQAAGGVSPVRGDDESVLLLDDNTNNSKRPPPLCNNFTNASTATFGGGPPSAPLSIVLLPSPRKIDHDHDDDNDDINVDTDTDSLLLGDDPDTVADAIAARIQRDEENKRSQLQLLGEERRRQLETELDARRRNLEAAKRNLEAARLRMAYPSPPASIQSEQGTVAMTTTTLAAPAPSPPRSQPVTATAMTMTTSISSHHNTSSSSSRRTTPSTPESGTEQWTAAVPTPASSSQASLLLPTAAAADGPPLARSRTEDNLAIAPRQQRYEVASPPRAATALGLFSQQQHQHQHPTRGPFDVHSDEETSDEYDDEYDEPPPPSSHYHHRSPPPVLRTVEAKRDAMVVGTFGRSSLGLQIEEFAKTLQQAQAMSALESAPPPPPPQIVTTTIPHSRAGSAASSNYSDLSESPVVVEPPLLSPKPFPLSPRPMGPRAGAAGAPPPGGRPTLEVRREEAVERRPFGSWFGGFPGDVGGANGGLPPPPQSHGATPEGLLGGRPASPAMGGRPRPPRLGAVKPARPPLGEYGDVKLSSYSAAARDSGIDTTTTTTRKPTTTITTTKPQIQPTPSSSAFEIDSPILKDPSPETSTPATVAAVAAVAGYNNSSSSNVFSPQQQPFGPAPTAPPCSPLPIPERSAARRLRKDSIAAALVTTTSSARPTTDDEPALQTSPSIVPDLHSNPHWPLPAPSASAIFVVNSSSPPVMEKSGGGFSAARRSRRRVPAPINIMATRYAGVVTAGGGPWTPEDEDEDDGLAANKSLSSLSSCLGPQQPQLDVAEAEQQQQQRTTSGGWTTKAEEQDQQQHGVDKSGGIGIARGPSIKFDRVRTRGERRAREHDRVKRMAIVQVDEEEDLSLSLSSLSPAPAALPAAGVMMRRPNHGLRSPMGFADEQGVRFI